MKHLGKMPAEYVPYGVAMGGINGTNIEAIREHLDSILRSPALIASLGSIATRYNEGNGGTTYFHDPQTGETLNSMGLPGIGIDRAKPLIREYSQKFKDVGKMLIVGISTLRDEDAAKILPELAERILEAGADRIEFNYSCPNIVSAGGGHKPIIGYDPEAMMRVRQNIVARIGKDQKFQEKLPPYIGEYMQLIPEIAKTYSLEHRLGRVGVSGFNTVPNVILKREGRPVLDIRATVDGEEIATYAGGLSGPAIRGRYVALQAEFLRYLPGDVLFIAAGGIWNGQDVKDRIGDDERIIGATAVSRFWEGEKTGMSFGRVATQVAEEYADAVQR